MLSIEGGEKDSYSISLATREGNWIRNVRKLERHPDAMKAAEGIWKKRFPGIRTRSLSSVYNCFGMAFASRRTWIVVDGQEVQDKILKDDKYRLLSDNEEPSPADILVYRKSPENEIDHVALVLRVESNIADAKWDITAISQWGGDGEYIHKMEEVPEIFGSHREFYTERVDL